MLVATAGHVDHGKTVLIKALTGVDTDRLPEEKARGLTIDLGFAYRELDDGQILGFVDVPGHERFVRNMLSGVAAIDYGLLVIAADDGPMPQTREHLAILNLLGIPAGAIAITKADRVEAGRVDVVASEAEALVAGTALEGAPVFPLAAINGVGVDALSAELIKHANSLKPPPPQGNFRLAIDRSFTVAGAGLIVTGTVFSGEVAVGDRVTLTPGNDTVRVRGIHAQNRTAEVGRQGERCALNIVGGNLDKDRIHRGDWLTSSGGAGETLRIDGTMQLLPTESKPLNHWSAVHLHLGAGFFPGRVALLEARRLEPGETGLVQIVVERPTWAVYGDRFVVRDSSAQRTIGGGTVIDPFGFSKGRAKPERLESLNALNVRDHQQALTSVLRHAANGIPLNEFLRSRNLAENEASQLVQNVPLFRLPGTEGLAFDPSVWEKLQTAITATLGSVHAERPEQVGVTEAEIRTALKGLDAANVTVTRALSALIQGGQIVRDGLLLRLKSHQAQLSDRDAKLWRELRHHITDTALQPPVVAELTHLVRMDKPALETFLQRITARGMLVRVAPNRFLSPKAVATLAGYAEALATGNAEKRFTAKEYRDRSGIGRNLTIQLLEFFDNLGYTRRIGDERIVVKSSREMFGNE